MVPFPVHGDSGGGIPSTNKNGDRLRHQLGRVSGKKKGVPWTGDEHKLFLLGLKRYGRGDWRNISRKFVQTRTPTQVASHAQKSFVGLNSAGEDKMRSIIHGITAFNLTDDQAPSPSQAPSLTTSPSYASAPTIHLGPPQKIPGAHGEL